MKKSIISYSLAALTGLALSALVATAPGAVFADDTGFKFPTATDTGTSGDDCTDPNQAFVDDVADGATNDALAARCKTVNGSSGLPDTQLYYNFGFTIPVGATIDGIEVIVDGYRTGPTEGAYFSVRLSSNGGTDWTDPEITAALTTTDAQYALGGTAYKWGATWDDASFSNANFRLEIKGGGVAHSGEHWKLDSVSVRVHYTLPTTAEGCGDGFWKNNAEKNGASEWTTYTPDALLSEVFDGLDGLGDLADATFLDALSFDNSDASKLHQLLRKAVTALLNAAHEDIDYPRTSADIISDVNEEIANGTPDSREALKDALEADNELGSDVCPD